MKSSTCNLAVRGKTQTLIAAAIAAVLLSACAAAPSMPAGAAEARAKLSMLQSNPDLATRAPVAMKDAEAAVSAAEVPESDMELGKHRVYLADRMIDIASAQATTALAEDQRQALSKQRDQARLDARTREADVAASQLATARVEIAAKSSEADAAHIVAADATQEAARANQQAADTEQQAAELQRQIDELHARPTDRGLVLTLGDVLFASGRAELKQGSTNNLDKLVSFLNEYPARTVTIEGYTDSLGSDDYNVGLSQRRADSVKTYLTVHGVGAARLSAVGHGESAPVAGNETAAGRQQNRRVEVIIANAPVM
jgi:outer membrane protein OmpA-like peptidoglycan-associated protein